MRLLKIKHENILALIYIPYAVINLSRASENMFLVAIAMQVLLFSGIYYAIKTTRKEIIADIKAGEYDDLIAEYNEMLERFRNLHRKVAHVFNSIKKGSYTKQPKTTKLTDAFLKYNF